MSTCIFEIKERLLLTIEHFTKYYLKKYEKLNDGAVRYVGGYAESS